MKFLFLLAFSLSLCLLSSCTRKVENAQLVDKLPGIYPDYTDVTIPVGIAPMDFNFADEGIECMDVVARGSKGGELHVQGDYADFGVDEWHELTMQNEGGDIVFTVCVLKGGKWMKYKNFKMHVSKYRLDDYGLTYRRIAPGYEVGGNIGIYQRDIHSFDEEAIIHVSAVPGQCMNCHTANRGSASQFLIHLRGGKGGTILRRDGKQMMLCTKTDSTKANCGYSYWHPSGNYIASSINSIHQLFYTGNERRIEVFDTMSDVLVIDARTNELILDDRLQTDDYESYPVFSHDGKTLYYCTAKYCVLPAEYEKAKYSLCKIGFDEKTGCYGAVIDTLINAEEKNASITFPRPSYDGRWLMYNVSDFGNFPVNHKEADLWLMNLATGESRALAEVNSDDVESFHNWSTDSHWFVFSSRRGDGMYTRVYISCIDENGKATKPFLLPQRNPKKFYDEMFDSYNCPDFTKEKVEIDTHQTSHDVMEGERINVRVR